MSTSVFNPIYQFLCKVLPLSPFKPFIARFAGLPFLGWLNWVVPVREILTVMSAYLVAVGLFYMYSVLMRWIKIIGD